MAESTALIDRCLQQLRVPAAQLLNPGLPSAKFEVALASRGLTAGPDLVALYGWHDGTKVGAGAILNDLHLVPGFYFLSLEEALEIHRQFVDEFQVNPLWFPIMADGSSGYSFVDCSQEEKQPVRHFTFEDENHEVEFASIGDMLATIAEAYDRGIFFVGQDGWLDMDWDAYWTLAANCNPRASYWAEVTD